MRVRVLRVIARMNVGGPAIHATLLTRELDPRRYESRLVTGAEDEAEGNYLALHGHAIDGLHEVPALGRQIDLLRDWSALRELVRLIRAFQPHIVHTHTAKAGLLGRIAARRCRVPIVVHTFHGHVFHGYFSPAKTAAFVWLERRLARLSSRLITVSETVRDEILSRGIGRADQFEVVRLGLDLRPFEGCERLAGSLKRELGLPSGTRTVVIVARLVPIKAHETFLDMAERLAHRFPDLAFLVVGDGERRAALEADARARGLAAHVHFLGWRADLDRVYADADVVTLTSKNEGSPVALIEAMAAGRPVVATRAGGVAELVGEAGVLAGVGDAEGLAVGVAGLLEHPDRARDLGLAARARILPHYGHPRLVSDIDALYQQLLREAGLEVA
jgi:glycosyltransferase involved in cell wall biosynthesis